MNNSWQFLSHELAIENLVPTAGWATVFLRTHNFILNKLLQSLVIQAYLTWILGAFGEEKVRVFMDGGPPVSTQPEPGAMILNPHYALGQLVELKKI